MYYWSVFALSVTVSLKQLLPASDPDTCPILLVQGGLRIAGKGVLPSQKVIEKGTGGVGREGGRGDGGDLQTRKLLTLESKSESQVFSNPLWS